MTDCPLVALAEQEYYLKETGRPIVLAEHHKRILNHAFRPDAEGKFLYNTIVLSMPKKSGKTELAGMIAYAFLRLYGGDVISIANDQEQAESRMFLRVKETLELMKKLALKQYEQVVDDEHLEKDRIIIKGRIGFRDRGQWNPGPHELRFIASDYGGEAGAMNALTVFDELWAFSTERGERLWMELPPIPTLPVSLRLVTTYAGFYGESELLYSIYDAAVSPDPMTDEPRGERVPGLDDLPCYRLGKTFVYWDHEARMPWHTEEFLEAARNDPAFRGREGEYRRLWENRWTTGEEAFIPMELIDELMATGEAEGLVNHMASW